MATARKPIILRKNKMMQQATAYQIPSGNVEEIRITKASLGGGFVVTFLSPTGPIGQMVFQDQGTMSQVLFGLLLAAQGVPMQQPGHGGGIVQPVPFEAIA